MTDAPCPGCGCHVASASHALVGLLLLDDVDGAIGRGLLDAVACEGCASKCVSLLASTRDERRTALAARERFRARERRLAERAARRDAARRGAAPAGPSALPLAAAAALQRALAKARGRA